MSLIRINRHPPPRQLLVFAAAWMIFVGVMGFLQWRQDRTTVAAACWGLAVLVPLAGLAWREGLRLLYVGLSYATFPIGFVISTLVLVVLYYAVVTPIGLIMRVFRYDPLARKFDRRAGSYWQSRGARKDPVSYFRQH